MIMKGTMVIMVHFINLQLTTSKTCSGYVTLGLVLIRKKKGIQIIVNCRLLTGGLGARNPGFIRLRKGFNRKANNQNIKALRNKL